MKKLIAILTAALMLAAAIPGLAFTGYDEAPEMPAIEHSDEAFFPAAITRYENEPEVSETPWGETVETWIPMEEETPFAAGETVTYGCEITVPAQLEGFDDEALASIEVRFDFSGIDGIEIVHAVGATPNYECNYDLGYCYPLPGFGNIRLEESCVVIDAELGRTVTVIVQGAAESGSIRCAHTVTIGQYELPAHFSIGKLTNEDGCFFIYEKDITAVQMCGMKFFAEDGLFDHYLVYFNNRDYVRDTDGSTVVYFDAENDDELITEGEKFDGLERAYHTVMDFFGFTDDGIGDAMTESVFLADCMPVRFETVFTLGEAPLEGDANGDGAVNTEDALLVLRAALGITDNAAELIGNCDMDNNGVLDTTDALLILRRALNIG